LLIAGFLLVHLVLGMEGQSRADAISTCYYCIGLGEWDECYESYRDYYGVCIEPDECWDEECGDPCHMCVTTCEAEHILACRGMENGDPCTPPACADAPPEALGYCSGPGLNWSMECHVYVPDEPDTHDDVSSCGCRLVGATFDPTFLTLALLIIVGLLALRLDRRHH
jgi:hypothetical protein